MPAPAPQVVDDRDSPVGLSYDQLRAKYEGGIECPPDFSFTQVLDKWAVKQPDATAIWWVASDLKTERKTSYSELVDLSHRAAVLFSRASILKHLSSLKLSGHGIRKGDRVMITLPRLTEWWITLFGLMRLGAVPIPGTTLLVAKGASALAPSCCC